MSKLFVTKREIDLIADLAKEVTKDVIGMKIYYYRVEKDLSDVHDVYEESMNKVFAPPVEIDALVEWEPGQQRTTKFGDEEYSNIIVYLHQRDLLDKEIEVLSGDYFSYGTNFFEITSAIVENYVFGQIDRTLGIKITGRQARLGQINFKALGPIGEEYDDENAVQNVFVQQRGEEENELGKTNDKRQLRADGKLEAPLSGPKKVSPDGTGSDLDSTFYGDE